MAMTMVAWSANPAPRCSVLFLGDQGHHKPAERYQWIKGPLAARGIDVSYTEKLEDLAPAVLAKYDVVMVYANIAQVSAEQEKAILDFVASGKGFVPVHCASACFEKNPALVELIGGKFKSHKTGVFKATIIHRDHPTMMGFGGFESWDETYIHTQHNEVERTVLMERTEGAVKEPWTWIRNHGQGRVFYTASGHDARTWQTPAFQDLLARGVAWSAGKIGASTLQELLSTFGNSDRTPLLYEERPTVQNYEKRTPYPKYQLPLLPKDSQDYIKTEHGFTTTLFAAEPDVIKPIAFTWDHRGRLWVAESVDYPSKYTDLWQGHDRIKICEDTDGDGKADKFTIFADKLNIPTGLVLANGGLIVSQAPQFLFLKDTNGDDVADERSVLMEGWGKGDTHAGPSNLRYGFDNKIYGAIGYSGYKGAEKSSGFRSGLFRMNKNATQLEFISQFSNNTWGLGISETGEIFGSTANRTHHCYIPIPIPYLDGVRGLSDNNELRKAIKIDAHYAANSLTDKIRQVDVFGGFTAAAGHNLYTARAFPQAYWNRAAFVCEPTMHLLHQGFLKRDGSGWTEAGDGGNIFASSDEWVAPVHAEVGPDGSVWIADWYNFIIQHNPTPRKEHGGFDAQKGMGNAHENPLRDETHGRIYRVTWNGAKLGRKRIDEKNTEDLLAALRDDNLFWRLAAQRLLVERNNTDVVPQLLAIVQDQTVDAIGLNGGVVQTLWTLHGLGVINEGHLEVLKVATKALHHPAAGVRRNAVQVLPATLDSAQALVAAGVLRDRDSNVTLAALLSASQLPASQDIGKLLFTLASDTKLMKDPYLSTSLKLACARHGLGYLQAARHAQVSVSTMEGLIGENMAMQEAIQEQVDALTWLMAGDPEAMAAVVAGMAKSWSQRDVPDTVTEAQRAALVALIAKAPVSVQQPLGSIVARWSGKVAKAQTLDDGPQLAPAEMKRFQSGQERYMTLCIACHQPNGQGLAGLAPSLVSSEWALGSVSRLARIVLHGLQGSITVNKQLFTAAVMMPPQKDVLDDVAIAEVLTFVRNAWGNKAAPVQTAEITTIREQEKTRSNPWTAEELLKLK